MIDKCSSLAEETGFVDINIGSCAEDDGVADVRDSAVTAGGGGGGGGGGAVVVAVLAGVGVGVGVSAGVGGGGIDVVGGGAVRVDWLALGHGCSLRICRLQLT